MWCKLSVRWDQTGQIFRACDFPTFRQDKKRSVQRRALAHGGSHLSLLRSASCSFGDFSVLFQPTRWSTWRLGIKEFHLPTDTWRSKSMNEPKKQLLTVLKWDPPTPSMEILVLVGVRQVLNRNSHQRSVGVLVVGEVSWLYICLLFVEEMRQRLEQERQDHNKTKDDDKVSLFIDRSRTCHGTFIRIRTIKMRCLWCSWNVTHMTWSTVNSFQLILDTFFLWTWNNCVFLCMLFLEALLVPTVLQVNHCVSPIAISIQ